MKIYLNGKEQPYGWIVNGKPKINMFIWDIQSHLHDKTAKVIYRGWNSVHFLLLTKE